MTSGGQFMNQTTIFSSSYSQEQTFTEIEADEVFPEFLKPLPSVALSVAFKCHDSKRWDKKSLTKIKW